MTPGLYLSELELRIIGALEGAGWVSSYALADELGELGNTVRSSCKALERRGLVRMGRATTGTISNAYTWHITDNGEAELLRRRHPQPSLFEGGA